MLLYAVSLRRSDFSVSESLLIDGVHLKLPSAGPYILFLGLVEGFFISMLVSRKKIDIVVSLMLSYYEKHGRSFPWRETKDPYHILVSEYMLQQTQVNRVGG